MLDRGLVGVRLFYIVLSLVGACVAKLKLTHIINLTLIQTAATGSFQLLGQLHKGGANRRVTIPASAAFVDTLTHNTP